MSTLLEFPDKKSGVNRIEQFLRESPQLKHFDLSVFSNNTIKDLIIKFNTPIPSSAAVERLFSTGKNVLKPKRSCLTDKHFEMLLFLPKKINRSNIPRIIALLFVNLAFGLINQKFDHRSSLRLLHNIPCFISARESQVYHNIITF